MNHSKAQQSFAKDRLINRTSHKTFDQPLARLAELTTALTNHNDHGLPNHKDYLDSHIMKLTKEQLSKMKELKVRTGTTIAILRQTAAKILVAAEHEMDLGHKRSAIALRKVAQSLEDIACGKEQ